MKPEPLDGTKPAGDTEMLMNSGDGDADGDGNYQQPQASSAAAVASTRTQSPGDITPPSMQSILDDGYLFMPPVPADLQAELASSASSSFREAATFGVMQQQLLSMFDGSPVLAGDFAADLLASPGFPVRDAIREGLPRGADGLAADMSTDGSRAGPPVIDISALHAAASDFNNVSLLSSP